MSRDASQEGEHGGIPPSVEGVSSGASDFEDSFLRELRLDEPLLPIPGEWLGGPDGRRYHVLEWMGGGGMGQVFRATDATLHREVALKFLLPRAGFAQEALLEARAVARLDHENIVRIFDVSEWVGIPDEPGVPFLVMECLEGESLSALLKRGRLEVGRALEVLDGIVMGLAHAHERGLVHRDLKPGNVFVTRQGTVKLLDFGLSHLMGAPHQPSAGTPAYMAPEQWRGEAQDARTDVWAAGAVLYELLTGGVPFSGATLAELRERVTSAEPVPSVRARNPEVPPEVEGLLSTALVKDPARRFPSARQLRGDLHELRARLSGPGCEASGAVIPRRQHLVLLSCRLTGLSELARRLDAEELAEVEAAFPRSCEEVIRRHGGYVGPSVVGEVFACFGCPRVREDDAERAVRAALHLTRELPELLQERLPHLSLSGLGATVGLHTGVMLMELRTLLGEVPRMVSWLTRHARPGEVRLSETLWQQVRGVFETEALEPSAFEGLTGPILQPAHRVLRAREVRIRFDRTLVTDGLTPLVGREPELRRLRALCDGAREGRGAFVLLRGEAGMGKSRLIQELCEYMSPRGALRWRFQCWSQPCGGALPPAVELLQRLLHSSRDGAPPRHPEEWAVRLGESGLPEEQVRLLGMLLSLPVPEDSPVLRFTPERRQEKTYEALVELLLRVARQRPILLVIEDLHWADSSWLAILGLLLERIQAARLLVVLSARPEFQPSWPSRDGLHRFTLERLPAELAASLVKEVAQGRELPEETVRELVEKTDGIPLFIEEMTRQVLEGGTVASIPVTLHELLLARLGLLPSHQKEVAQVGAVVGRDFPLELLAAVTGCGTDNLRCELAALMEAGLLEESRDAPDRPGYQFRHALFQEAAYQSLARSERKRHHQRIARVLEEHFSRVVEARPELLAHHFMEAGEDAPAVVWWIQAGLQASRVTATPEAERYFQSGLEALHRLPDAAEHRHQELTLQLGLGSVQGTLYGFRAPQVERAYSRVWELLHQLGDALEEHLPPRFWWAIFAAYQFRAELSRVHELAGWVMRLGEQGQKQELLAVSHRMMALCRASEGRMRAALEHAESGVRAAESCSPASRALTLPIAGLLHAMVGEPDQARRRVREAIAEARRASEPHILAFVLAHAALSHQVLREPWEIPAQVEEAITISSEHGYVMWRSLAMIVRCWALSELGHPSEALEPIRREIESWERMGIWLSMPHNLLLLADIHLKLGQVRRGLAVVRETLGWVRSTGQHLGEAEVYREVGELLRAGGRKREAKSWFLRALAVAREQETGLYELRATVGLGRLLRELGREAVARRLLARACARFEAGGESTDLREARALLAALSGDESLEPRAAPSVG